MLDTQISISLDQNDELDDKLQKLNGKEVKYTSQLGSIDQTLSES